MNMEPIYAPSNNVYKNLPGLMSDGRSNTDYSPACENNEKLKQQLGLTSNYEYRQYLINNGNNVAKRNFEDSAKYSHFVFSNDKTYDKYLFKSLRDKTKTPGSEESDLKNMYLSRVDLQSKMTGPIISQEELLKH